MLTRLRVRNFRLLREVEIDFAPDVTVFIGPNASGKSTVLAVLDFLSRCAESGLLTALTAHGGYNSIRTAGEGGNIGVGVDLTLTYRKEPWHLSWDFELESDADGSIAVHSESLVRSVASEQQEALISTSEGVRWVVAEDGANVGRVSNRAKLAFESLMDDDRFPALGVLRVLMAGARVLGNIASAPAWGRANPSDASPRDSLVLARQLFLGRQGNGLANVLYGIQTDSPAEWEELQRTFRAEFPFAGRIVFPADVGGGKISFEIEDSRFYGRRVRASELSDGIISYLCLLAAVLQPLQLSVLGLDEPDCSLHPSALRRFMALAQSEHPKRRLAIVTHSNALLDELREPGKSIRIIEPGEKGAVVRRLDGDSLKAWRNEYSLSDMRRTGLLDSANTEFDSEA